MRTLLLPALLVGAAIAASGCGGDDNEPGQPPDEAITYYRTGGIAGITETLEIEPDGQATLETGPPEPASTEFRVSDAQLEDLRAEAEAAGFSELETDPEPTGCNDCFLYEVTIGDQTFSADDTNFPEELEALRAQLQEIADAHRKAAITGG